MLQKYIILNGVSNNPLIQQLNQPEYKDYKVLAIMSKAFDHVAYLELKPTELIKEPINVGTKIIKQPTRTKAK